MSEPRILIVRLGALGDLVHTIPVAAALRAAYPGARLDWLVEPEGLELLRLVPVIDERIAIETGKRRRSSTIDSWREVATTVNELRATGYDIALDLQGLWKSAVLARSSGASRVIGFDSHHLKEPGAAWMYTERGLVEEAGHVIEKNLSLLETLGIHTRAHDFPLSVPLESASVAHCLQQFGEGDHQRVAVINGGAAWPNKRWPSERYGAVAGWLYKEVGYRSLVVWGPGEEPLACRIQDSSNGAAIRAPMTTVTDLLVLFKRAKLLVSGDTGPLHLAAAVGTPIVGIYGPTDPGRNGPWLSADLTVSKFSACRCHYRRTCRMETPCMMDVTVEEVTDAIGRRLGVPGFAGRTA